MSGPEWYCRACWRWVNGLVCPGCLRCDPDSVRWATESEIREARKAASSGGETHG